MPKKSGSELAQGVSLFVEGQETVIIERVDDVVSVSLEPVPVISVHEGIAYTGIQHAADYLGLHPNTIRRYADGRILESVKSPGGVKRIMVDSLKEVHDGMYAPWSAENS